MFDVFHNVFGKKKQSEPERGVEAEEFEIIEKSPNENRVEIKNSMNHDMPPSYLNASPYLQLAHTKSPMERTGAGAEASNVNTLTIQDVPFQVNSSLNVDHTMHRIFHGLDACLASISEPVCLQMEYDFSLERSVLAETT